MFGNQNNLILFVMAIVMLSVVPVYCQEQEQSPSKEDRYLTKLVPPQELLKVYAEEKEKSAYFFEQSQFFLNKNDNRSFYSLFSEVIMYNSMYWNDYRLAIENDMLYYTDEMMDEEQKSMGPLKQMNIRFMKKERAKRQEEDKIEREKMYDGAYKLLGGRPFLWKILDRKKDLNGEQRIYLQYFGSWPDYEDVQSLQWKIPELLRLKLVCFILLTNYHFNQENVSLELIRRYNDFKPATLGEWVIKEQMRGVLRTKIKEQSIPELKEISEKSLNYSDEYIAWKIKENKDNNNKENKKDKYLTEYVPPQELLRVYADELEKPLYFQAQVKLVNEDPERKKRYDEGGNENIKKTSLYWIEYRFDEIDYLLDNADAKIDYLISSFSEEKKKYYRIMLEKMANLRKRIEIEDHNVSYGGVYRDVAGPTYLWKILDRKKEINGFQGFALVTFLWPDDKNEIERLEQSVPELLKLKNYAFAFLTNYTDCDNVSRELIRRYNEFNPTTYEEWVVKEQMRVNLVRAGIDKFKVPEIMSIPKYTLNLSNKYIQWKEHDDKIKKEKAVKNDVNPELEKEQNK